LLRLCQSRFLVPPDPLLVVVRYQHPLSLVKYSKRGLQ